VGLSYKEWDKNDDSGIEMIIVEFKIMISSGIKIGKVGLKREEWDCDWIVG
jgi:hypothetical protein